MAMTLDEKKHQMALMEWDDFSTVNAQGGKAPCQEDYDAFMKMRESQFSGWTEELTDSYTADLRLAKETGRSLLSEKYAWMMETTAPADFARIRHMLPYTEPAKLELIREIMEIETEWFREYMDRYPNLSAGNRKLDEDNGSIGGTSMATYLEGELKTYSTRTVRLYLEMDRALKERGENLTIKVVDDQMKRSGFRDIDEAEASLA